GNGPAQEMIAEVYEVCDRSWRGLGLLSRSGLRLNLGYLGCDAAVRFPDVDVGFTNEPEECRSGEVLQGLIRPDQCESFGKRCTPDRPLGAPMVSSEGACAAYHRYGRIPLGVPNG